MSKIETPYDESDAEFGTGERCRGCDSEIMLASMGGDEIAVRCACGAVAALS